MTPAWRDFQRPGRSEALGTECMVSTPHAQASLAALETLRAGGNAVDAAVCAAAMLAVVDPTQTGIGGDCFILFVPGGTGEVIALDGSGWAPRAADTGWYVEHGFAALPWNTPHAVTVPGAVSAWCRIMADHGRLGLGAVFRAAIEAAERGYPVTERVAHDWVRKEAKLSGHEHAARIFLPGGHAPRFGSLHRQPQLGATLRAIAAGGSAAFYTGAIAEDIVGTLRAMGGLHVLDDLAEFTAEYVRPIQAGYREHVLWQCPPAGVGVVALMIARALERIDLAGMTPLGAEWIHHVGEVGRLAYAMRDAVLGDPRTGVVPLDWLLSDACAAQLATAVDPARRLDALDGLTDLPDHRDTVLVTIVDRDRNCISLINSNFDDFGSGIVAGQSGVLLQNRGCGFVVRPGHPNTVAGRKRPMHTIIPGLLTRDGRVSASFGVTGGQLQPSGQMQFVSHLLDHQASLQRAVDQPRFFSTAAALQIEQGVAPHVADQLKRMGYAPVLSDEALGTAHAVSIDWDAGILHGAADARRDGLAIGW